jgi:L-asparaginase II
MARKHAYRSGWCATGSREHARCAGEYAGVLCVCPQCGDHKAAPAKNVDVASSVGQTASYRLIEASIGRPLSAHVTECRGAGLGWRQIATDLRDATHVGVSHESLRGWFK